MDKFQPPLVEQHNMYIFECNLYWYTLKQKQTVHAHRIGHPTDHSTREDKFEYYKQKNMYIHFYVVFGPIKLVANLIGLPT